MAQAGGNRKTSSKLQKEHYKRYKLENRAEKNKIKKLIKHCKRFPNDKKCAERLAELKSKGGYKPRKKPLIPGSNPTEPKIINMGYFQELPETPGEQLSRLLGIPLPKPRTRKSRKTKITHKSKKQ